MLVLTSQTPISELLFHSVEVLNCKLLSLFKKKKRIDQYD